MLTAPGQLRWEAARRDYASVLERYEHACAQVANTELDMDEREHWHRQALRLHDMATRYYEKAKTAEADFVAAQTDQEPF